MGSVVPFAAGMHCFFPDAILNPKKSRCYGKDISVH
jgi:hypothetical protein